MSSYKKVLVIFPGFNLEQMPMLHGIGDYARERGTWILYVNPFSPTLQVHHLAGWQGDGLIAILRSKREVAAAEALGLPTINLSGALRQSPVPRVMVDQEAMGRLAAEHMMECGLRHMAFYGERGMWYSQQRKKGFLDRLSEAGCECSVFESGTRFHRAGQWNIWMSQLEDWLKSLPRPVGLLAVHDSSAVVLVDACSRLGLRVPQDVAVMGIGNDPVTCEFCAVPLSSVARSNQQVGYRAAALLDRLMAGKKPPRRDALVPPEGVVKRRSTDVIATDDPCVTAAVHYIHEHVDKPFSIDAVWRHLSISHRLLELRFREHLGCTPYEYICRTRVERAKHLLLADRNLKLQQIAAACGFTGPRHLLAVFRRFSGGLTPEEYRRQTIESQLPLPDAATCAIRTPKASANGRSELLR